MDRDNLMNYISTRNGIFSYDNIEVDGDVIDDALHALKNINRFGGHARPWTVAQHSVLCATLAMQKYGYSEGSNIVKGCLIHDLHEAFYGDVPTPLKRHLKEKYNLDYNNIVAEFDSKLFEYLEIDLTEEEHAILKSIDWEVFKMEMARFSSHVIYDLLDNSSDITHLHLVDECTHIDLFIFFERVFGYAI